jgi:hypothetical protein
VRRCRQTNLGDMTATNRFSPVLLTAAGLVMIGGVVAGAVEYIRRSPGAERHAPGTSAWTVHLLLTGLAVLWTAGAFVLARRRRTGLQAFLTAPLRQQAAGRLQAARRCRVMPAAALVALLSYNLWRAGEQVIAGLNPNFTANAWGGPSYLGAMYCHYLDLGLLNAAAALLLNRLVLPVHPKSDRGNPGPTTTASQAAAPPESRQLGHLARGRNRQANIS